MVTSPCDYTFYIYCSLKCVTQERYILSLLLWTGNPTTYLIYSIYTLRKSGPRLFIIVEESRLTIIVLVVTVNDT